MRFKPSLQLRGLSLSGCLLCQGKRGPITIDQFDVLHNKQQDEAPGSAHKGDQRPRSNSGGYKV